MTAQPPATARAENAVLFVLDADPSPGVLPRLLQPFARRDLIPDDLRSRRSAAAMHVEILIGGATGDDIDRIEGNLRQIVGVRAVARVPARGLRQVA